VVERQLPKLNVARSNRVTRFGVLRCAGLHNAALCTELRAAETAGKRALILHRIAHNCTRKRPLALTGATPSVPVIDWGPCP
jgi:hypothetical protein